MKENTLVEVKHVSLNFGKEEVLKNIDLSVKSGEIIGFLGPSGAGKTTLVKAIVGMNLPNEGDISVFDEQMPSLKVVRDIGYMAQADALYDDLSGIDNLTFFASLYGMKHAAALKRANELLELIDLQKDAKKLVKNYSGGMKRRLSLSIALIHEPRLLILDEPTIGIDPVLRRIFWGEFKRLQQKGTTIIITTHVMDEAAHCDRLAFLRNGEITAIGTPKELMDSSGQDTIEEAFLYFGGEREERYYENF